MKTLLVLCLAFAATLALPKSPFQEQWSQFKVSLPQIQTRTSDKMNFSPADPQEIVQFSD
jgi:hypothetical protein